MIFGLYPAVSLQKAVRDNEEDIPVSGNYYGLGWLACHVAIFLLAIGLYHAS
ncbi:hypothetical protein [Rossellomorea sp. DUT-2]|uniref:hypothetical protein n=1 Tax=Rossellomorea sp. DUT-2 TaxID=3412021 RepID=UPI003D183D7A